MPHKPVTAYILICTFRPHEQSCPMTGTRGMIKLLVLYAVFIISCDFVTVYRTLVKNSRGVL